MTLFGLPVEYVDDIPDLSGLQVAKYEAMLQMDGDGKWHVTEVNLVPILDDYVGVE